MSATKFYYKCVECNNRTSTTHPTRAALRVCVRCPPEIKTALPVAKAKFVRAAAPAIERMPETPTMAHPANATPAAETTAPGRETVGEVTTLPTAVVEVKSSMRKKVSALDAAVMVLRDSTTAMTPKEIFAAIVERRLWASKKGKTPCATLAAAMGREIAVGARDGKTTSRFVKTERGRFAANTPPGVA